MGLLGKVVSRFQKFGGKPEDKNSGKPIEVLDRYGRTLEIDRDEWVNNVLIHNMEKVKDDPDALYNMIIGAMHDGFMQEVLIFSRYLYNIDPDRERSTTVLGICLMHTNRWQDAEELFNYYLASDGPSGIVMTNLAKVYNNKGDEELAFKTLLAALNEDPNQDNGLEWYAALEKEKGGAEAEEAAFKKISEVPGSWRSQLYLARFALERDDIKQAVSIYQTVLQNFESIVPSDFLFQMSGDLGLNGYINAITTMVQPCYQPEVHGIQTGNNIIKALVTLERFDEAKSLVDELFRLDRPDWSETLNFWDSNIAEHKLKNEPERAVNYDEFFYHSFQAPIWLGYNKPFEKFFPEKGVNAPSVIIFGGVVIRDKQNDAGKSSLTDTTGRLSRSIPLGLGEYLQFKTPASVINTICYHAQVGFAVFQRSPDASELVDHAKRLSSKAAVAINFSIHNDGGQVWVEAKVISITSNKSMTCSQPLTEEDGVRDIQVLYDNIADVIKTLSGIATVSPPAWYSFPQKEHVPNYLLRLEQQLALYMDSHSADKGTLYGEHEILQGAIQLCAYMPSSVPARLICAMTARELGEKYPDIIETNADRFAGLNSDLSQAGEMGRLVQAELRKLILRAVN
ncbi:MAG: tetratricopeptide repeat protein [Candidatus Pelagadaptatus aseana]|uniref:tetratricopeptide repeat protein n=1 Tax=Candidatus Pelagadaptatus aseana TaxID=3120508 RepID=UPI0039B2F187